MPDGSRSLFWRSYGGLTRRERGFVFSVTSMHKKQRYAAVAGIWSYAATDPRLSDAEFRVYLVALSLINAGAPNSITALARVLMRSEGEVRKAVHRLVECRYMVDREEDAATLTEPEAA